MVVVSLTQNLVFLARTALVAFCDVVGSLRLWVYVVTVVINSDYTIESTDR